ncbi:unnamed protein product [Arctia plantaginis]|uniref:FLYWCH-type domain-containing protein n=1 Tax=Arctia plantaginis TaxID=874455 RepID=A0A8S1AZ80_ARCPL|nr:unnamed protein product [Arctia plantaginis]
MYARFQCPAVLTLDAFNSVVCVRGDHNHPDPVIFDTPREALIIPSRNKRGQGMLVFRNYTYSWRNHKKNGSYWTCSSHHKKGPVIIKGKKKGQYFLLYNSYTYTRSATSKKGKVWKCTSFKAEDCKVRMTTDDNLNVVVTKGDHNHDPPERESKPKHFFIKSNQLAVSVVTAIDGATLLMLNGYSFTNPSPMTGGERWYCSGRMKWKCNVCLHVNDDYELVCISNEHTHKAPVYDRTPDGLYVQAVP